MHIDHINISAPTELLEKVKVFYCDVFGLQEGFRPNFKRNGFWLYADNNPIIHLTESNEHFGNDRQGFLDHIAFQFTGLAAVLEKLNLLGVEYSIDHLSEIGMTQIFFNDPAGIGIEANFLAEKL